MTLSQMAAAIAVLDLDMLLEDVPAEQRNRIITRFSRSLAVIALDPGLEARSPRAARSSRVPSPAAGD